MFWPRRGQLPLLCCIILIFSYYFSNGWQMQKEGMVIKDTLDKIKDKEPSCTSTIVENFNGWKFKNFLKIL